MANKPAYLNFNSEHYPWQPNVNYRENPDLYKVGKGEQGVLICEPYKSEIGQFWRFKTKAIAEESSKMIQGLFRKYLGKGDFVGADMARKYLQMGYTRARRYANYKGGKKYDRDHDYAPLDRGTGEPEKTEGAKKFYVRWREAEADPIYSALKRQWKRDRG